METSGRGPRVAGFGMVEVLIGAAILALCIVPILTLSRQNVRRTAEERARIAASMLASNAVARFSAYDPLMDRLLVHKGAGEVYSDDLLTNPDVSSVIGVNMLANLINEHSMVLVLHMRPRVTPGADLVTAEVTFRSTRSGFFENVRFQRLLVDGLTLAQPGGP